MSPSAQQPRSRRFWRILAEILLVLLTLGILLLMSLPAILLPKK